MRQSPQFSPFLRFLADPVSCRCDQRHFPLTIELWMTIDPDGISGLQISSMGQWCSLG